MFNFDLFPLPLLLSLIEIMVTWYSVHAVHNNTRTHPSYVLLTANALKDDRFHVSHPIVEIDIE